MDDTLKAQIVDRVLHMLQQPDCRVVFMRPPERLTEPGDSWERYATSKTSYILIAAGPYHQYEETATHILSNVPIEKE